MLNVKKLLTKVLTGLAGKVDKTVSFYDYNKFTYSNGCSAYSTSGTSTRPVAYKQGRVVMIAGAIKFSSTAQSSAALIQIGKVPSGCEPAHYVRMVKQGSGQNRFALTIQTDGVITADRYGVESHIAITENAYLTIGCTYISAS